MELNYDEEAMLASMLIPRFTGETQFREIFLGPFLGTPFAERVPFYSKIGLFVRTAVRQCNGKAGWQTDPSALRQLFDWHDLANESQDLAKLDARIRGIEAENKQLRSTPSILEPETIINETAPFVNRSQFRSAVQELTEPSASQKPILLVEGGTLTGKTYSVEYIDHLKSVNGGLFNTYVRTFDSDQGLSTTPEDLARELFMLMGQQLEPDGIPSDKTNLKKYVRDLAMRVLSEAAQREEPQHWIILDNYSGNLREDTREFLKALSEEVTNGVFAIRCRLIFLGADRDLLSLVRTTKYREESVTRCSRRDIEKTLREILLSTPAVQPAAVDMFVFDKLPDDVWRMWEINRRLGLLLQAVRSLAALEVRISPDTFDVQTVLMGFLAKLPELPPTTLDEPEAEIQMLTAYEKEAKIRNKRKREAESIKRGFIQELEKFQNDILDSREP